MYFFDLRQLFYIVLTFCGVRMLFSFPRGVCLEAMAVYSLMSIFLKLFLLISAECRQSLCRSGVFCSLSLGFIEL